MIGYLGGTVSLNLTKLLKVLWVWVLSKDIVFVAEHIQSCVADAESRT